MVLVNGYRIWNRLFNRLDICNSCMKKIKQLSTDVKDEERYVDELFDKHEIYENANLLKSCVFISHKYEDLRAAKR